MKHLLLCLFLTLSIPSLDAQDVKIISINESFKSPKNVNGFEPLARGTHKDSITEVATLRVSFKVYDAFWCDDLYFFLRREAKHKGANLYKLVKIDSTNIIVNLYNANDSVVKRNIVRIGTNRLIVIGNLDPNKTNTKLIRINGKKIKLQSQQYVLYQNAAGKRAKLKSGGLAGTSFSFTGYEGRPDQFFKIGKGRLIPRANGGGISMGYTGAKPQRVKGYLGRFLTQVLEQQMVEGLYD